MLQLPRDPDKQNRMNGWLYRWMFGWMDIMLVTVVTLSISSILCGNQFREYRETF